MALDLKDELEALVGVWRDRVVVEWEGRRVPVVSRAGLLTMKRIAGRPKTCSISARSNVVTTMKHEVDMSPAAIARRFRQAAGLYRLARSLQNARVLDPAESPTEQSASVRLPPATGRD